MNKKAIITAFNKHGVIGVDGKLPWHLPEDLKWFRKITMGGIVVMGRKTWESINKPLPGREIFIVSNTISVDIPSITVVRNIDEAMGYAELVNRNLFFVGGYGIFKEALPLIDTLYISHIDCPQIDNSFKSNLTEIKSGCIYFPEFNLWKSWTVKNIWNYSTHRSIEYVKIPHMRSIV